MFAFAAQTFLMLFWINAPYGRFARSGWGPTLRARVAWLLMESPAVLVFAAVYFNGGKALETVPLVLFAAWQGHYVVRTLIYPLRIHETGKRVPAVVALLGFIFNVVNAYINARWISEFGNYDASWLASAPFIVGMFLFVAGFVINQHADRTLLTLRKPGETHYKTPHGGLFRYVSCPNYLGEMIEWAGWAIMSWSLAGLAFAVFTVANLLPRALANHRWYRREFDDYPASRRAVIPFLL